MDRVGGGDLARKLVAAATSQLLRRQRLEKGDGPRALFDELRQELSRRSVAQAGALQRHAARRRPAARGRRPRLSTGHARRASTAVSIRGAPARPSPTSPRRRACPWSPPAVRGIAPRRRPAWRPGPPACRGQGFRSTYSPVPCRTPPARSASLPPARTGYRAHLIQGKSFGARSLDRTAPLTTFHTRTRPAAAHSASSGSSGA